GMPLVARVLKSRFPVRNRKGRHPIGGTETLKHSEQNERFQEWCRAHGAILWKVARAYAPPGQHEELHQDLLIALWHAAPFFRDEAKASTYIYRVALNGALSWH